MYSAHTLVHMSHICHLYDNCCGSSMATNFALSSDSQYEYMDREPLNRHCLEEAHMRFCMLDVFRRYKEVCSTWKICSNLQQSLDEMTPHYYNTFTSRYGGKLCRSCGVCNSALHCVIKYMYQKACGSSKGEPLQLLFCIHSYTNSTFHLYSMCLLSSHVCEFPGCRSVLIMDGNMKNRRDVCAASEAEYIEYEGLPGALKTGCQFSPAYQTKYCNTHAPRISLKTDGKETKESCNKEGVMRMITAKKQTRSETYYQVRCNFAFQKKKKLNFGQQVHCQRICGQNYFCCV